MYFKDKTEVFKVRLTQEQVEFILRLSVAWGVSKSEVMRKIVDSYKAGGINNENK